MQCYVYVIQKGTGKSLLEDLILASTNSQYDKRLFRAEHGQNMGRTWVEHGQNMGRTWTEQGQNMYRMLVVFMVIP